MHLKDLTVVPLVFLEVQVNYFRRVNRLISYPSSIPGRHLAEVFLDRNAGIPLVSCGQILVGRLGLWVEGVVNFLALVSSNHRITLLPLPLKKTMAVLSSSPRPEVAASSVLFHVIISLGDDDSPPPPLPLPLPPPLPLSSDLSHNQPLLSAYCLPGTILNVSLTLSNLILIAAHEVNYYHFLQFTDEERKVQRV